MPTTANYLSQEDFDRILEAIPTLHIRKWGDEDVQYLLKLLYHLALRPMEGIMLEKEMFDLKNRKCYLGKTKTQKASSVVIPKVFIDELAQWLCFKHEGRLFPNLTYPVFWTWLKRLGKMLEIQPWESGNRVRTGELTVGHIFRKSWGKDMIDADKSIMVISKQLRHTTYDMTYNKYLKVTEQKVLEEI